MSAARIRTGTTVADVRAALAALSAYFRPCGAKFAGEQLALLRARTKMRADQDGKLLAVAYIDWLAEFPADVAKAACEELARSNVFFPAWAEVEAACGRLMTERKTLRKALEDALKPQSGNALYLGKPLPETRADRLKTIRDAWARNGNPNRSARAERELAALEGREPEEWARNMPEEEPRAAPAEAPPFQPANDAKTQRMRELAAKWRVREEANRNPHQQAAE